ncbi:MAG: PIG-L family deacetylase [Spirochaetota bacterium]|nr:PIG-L family deacetylase [Spirochaetota bacterium]
MIDILAISPHPDDAEIGCGGLLLLSKKQGRKTGILHMTLGEMGTGGTDEIRLEEMKNAAAMLELDFMEYAGFKDCQITDSFENRLTIARYIRQLKPKIVLLPYWDGVPGRGIGHTDHLATGIMASHAVNFARLKKMPIDLEPHSVRQVLYYLFPRELKPTFIADISAVAPQWIKALKCHHSQMFGPHAKKTGFFRMLLSYSKQMGFQIGARYGLGFIAADPFKLQDPFKLIGE